jgi:hypothetical protein
MPTISVFFGITVRMFFSDHPPAHFHVRYQRHRAVIAIESGAIISGALAACGAPPRARMGRNGIARS